MFFENKNAVFNNHKVTKECNKKQGPANNFRSVWWCANKYVSDGDHSKIYLPTINIIK